MNDLFNGDLVKPKRFTTYEQASATLEDICAEFVIQAAIDMKIVRDEIHECIEKSKNNVDKKSLFV